PSFSVDFIDLEALGHGWFRGGAHPGWEFSIEDHSAFLSDVRFRYLSDALSTSSRSRLQQRSVLGARLLSSSSLAQDPDQKLLAAVMALEVLLADSDSGPQKLRIARRAGFLSCSIPMKSMCGRDRPACQLLALDPGIRSELDEINEINARQRGDHLF